MRKLRNAIDPLYGVTAIVLLALLPVLAIASAHAPMPAEALCNEDTYTTLPDGTEAWLREGEIWTVEVPPSKSTEDGVFGITSFVDVWYNGETVVERNVFLRNADVNWIFCQS